MEIEIDHIIRNSLTSFFHNLCAGTWLGNREKETVGLYVFSHLLKRCAPCTCLYDPAQIGIEVAVPQIKGDLYVSQFGVARPKDQVCKDIVIWPQPEMTCWDKDGNPTIFPLAILEWKYNEPLPTDKDTLWLKAYSSRLPDFAGYTVQVQRSEENVRLDCKRFHRGEIISDWLMLHNP